MGARRAHAPQLHPEHTTTLPARVARAPPTPPHLTPLRLSLCGPACAAGGMGDLPGDAPSAEPGVIGWVKKNRLKAIGGVWAGGIAAALTYNFAMKVRRGAAVALPERKRARAHARMRERGGWVGASGVRARARTRGLVRASAMRPPRSSVRVRAHARAY